METGSSAKTEPADAVAVAMEAADAVDDSKSWEVAAGADSAEHLAASGDNNVMHAVLTADGRTVAISYDPETGQYVTENGEPVVIQQEQPELVTSDTMESEPGDLITVEAQMADLSEAASDALLESTSPTSSNISLALSTVDSAAQGQSQIRYINASTGQEVSQPQQIRLVNADGSMTEVRTAPTSVAMSVQRNASSIRSPTGQIRIVRMDGTTVQQVQQQPQQQQQQVRIFNADGTLTNLSGNVRVISSSQLLQQQLGGASMAGKQIRVVRAGSGPMGGAMTNSPTKTITLAQAQQMGLLSPGKVRNFQLSPVKTASSSSSEVKQIVIRSAGNASAQAQTQPQVIRIPASSLQPGTIQQLQVGNRVQYVRVVGQAQGNQVVSVKSGTPIAPASTTSKPASAIPVGAKNLKVAIPSSAKTASTMPAAATLVSKPQQAQQRVILPSGQTFKTIVPHQMPELSMGSSASATTGLMTNTYEAFASKKVERTATSASEIASEAAMTTYEPSGVRPRKPCNCTKSQCLKLYCDCFANGEFCNNCNCNHCFNNLVHEEERQKAIKQCLDRNPSAFKPKIGRVASDGERRHNKGCNCKRSGCLKNYCECYEAKIPCTDACKCLGCKNVEEETGRKREVLGSGQQTPGAPSLAAATNDHAGRRDHFLADIKPNLKSKLAPLTRSSAGSSYGGGPRLPFSFITPEVVEATCQCLLAQAEESERSHQSEAEAESAILEEFGRCLAQIIEMANKTKVT